MDLLMYLRETHGVELSRLPSAGKIGRGAVSAELYGELFAAIKAKGPSDPVWIENKRLLGKEISRQFLEPWQQRHGRAPRILATGAGEGWAECVWLDQGCEVTLQDGTNEHFDAIRARQPRARFILADMNDFDPEGELDFITMLANDFVLDRAGLADFIRRMAGRLTPSGAIVCSCSSVLSMRRIMIEAIRRVSGYHRRNGWVRWGWWRSPSEFRRAARAAGLELTRALEPGPRGWRERAVTIPPWKQSNGLFLLERKA